MATCAEVGDLQVTLTGQVHGLQVHGLRGRDSAQALAMFLTAARTTQQLLQPLCHQLTRPLPAATKPVARTRSGVMGRPSGPPELAAPTRLLRRLNSLLR